MTLSCKEISKWDLTKEGVITLIGSMSPMTTAQKVVAQINHIANSNLRLTNLFRVKASDSEMFTTWEDADLHPVSPDILIAVLNFKYIAMFADLGYKTIPICLDLGDGSKTLSKAYLEFPWIKTATKKEISNVIDTIDRINLKLEFEKFVSCISIIQANRWFDKLPAKTKCKISNQESDSTSRIWWSHQDDEEKVLIYKLKKE